MMQRIVSVIGADPCSEQEFDFARRLGGRLAEMGLSIACGGLGGTMQAVCQGSHESGGLTIGFLPGPDTSQANPFLSVAIPTGMGELRNGLVVRAGEVVVAVGGGWGTLSEIAMAMKAEKLVIGWNTWSLDQGRAVGSIISVASAEAACREIEKALSLGTAA
jgi:uncharacterized protein (TIGR00725 family)